jgi:hypothetical protein
MNRLPEIEAMYAMMNDQGRDFFFGMARQLLRSFPGESARGSPATAEKGGDVQLVNDKPDCRIYHFPLSGIGKPVHRKKADLG